MSVCDYRTDFDKRIISMSMPWVLAQDTDPLAPKPEPYKKKSKESYMYKYMNEVSGYTNNTLENHVSCPCGGRRMNMPTF
jgi:hypothetical protein